jgi:dynein heavy chain
VFVPTTDSVLYTFILEKLAPRKPLLFVGESGTAKTMTIQNYLGSLPSEANMKLNINFSSRTTSLDVQTNIEANVDKRSGIKYGPPAGKKLVIFVDDMNMPKVDLYGTQQPITLLLFLMGRGSLYDRGKDLNLKILEDLNYIAAMGPPGGGRNNVDPRFVALFNVYNLTPPTADVLRHIYSSILITRYAEFPEPVKEVAAKFTEATLTLFGSILEKLPPTPSKFHYIFNLRDLSRVYEGLCLATPDKFARPQNIVRLWRNETQRIFCDRLTTAADLAFVNGEIEKLIRERFSDHAEHAMTDPVIFGDYELAVRRITEDAEDPRLYQDLVGYNKIRRIFDEVLESYNVEYKPMTLVLFEVALEHLTRIMRIIRMPRGNALLVGVGGSGKQSLTRLASFCAGYKLFEISLVRNYGENEFREDLKKLYGMLGKEEVVFLFTDAHVVEEGFLEFINNMVTTGVVPALFEQDEKDQAINSVRKELKERGIPETPDNCWNYYVNKCRNNLHIVLAMSPSGERLRIRCRSFPGLVSACVIDWFYPWPADALQKVAEYFLAEEPLPNDQREKIIEHLVFAHQGVVGYAQRFADTLRRYYYVTPKNYLDLIANYRSQLKVNDKKIEQSVKRLDGGLTKLIDAAVAVDRMQVRAWCVVHDAVVFSLHE